MVGVLKKRSVCPSFVYDYVCIRLELVCSTETDDALVQVAHETVLHLEVEHEVVCQVVLSTATEVHAELASVVTLFNGYLAVCLSHRSTPAPIAITEVAIIIEVATATYAVFVAPVSMYICQTYERIYLELVTNVEQVVSVSVDFSHCEMVFREEIVERSLATNVVCEAVRTLDTKAERLDFCTIVKVKTDCSSLCLR